MGAIVVEMNVVTMTMSFEMGLRLHQVTAFTDLSHIDGLIIGEP